jgi:hypothetical protein
VRLARLAPPENPAVVPPSPSPVQRVERTGISGFAVLIAGYLVVHVFHVAVPDQGWAIAGVTVVLTTIYNAFVLWAERRWKWARFLTFNLGGHQT